MIPSGLPAFRPLAVFWGLGRVADYTLGTRGNRWALNSMLRMDANLSQHLIAESERLNTDESSDWASLESLWQTVC